MANNLDSIQMKSADLIKKEPLDYGGFGEVHLCYHKTLGQVVLKTVYTGPPSNETRFSKKSLLEEGNLMTRLKHERVVKLLGVILEDGDYSLVLELIPKGNLLAMLEKVNVPQSIKGRIILEILEGMVYLTENRVIHKDLKPENILVDEDFHIKIADLGLATCQTWSRLTKKESRRHSHMRPSTGARAAGTLCYMAPEHLESIHAHSTEKSDVYSFSIVVWVILTNQEPYENALNEDQICQCVRKGDRPDETLITDDTLPEITELMKRCWQQNPQNRPTFQVEYKSFQPIYQAKLEPYVEEDSLRLRALYEGPEDLVEKIKSLSLYLDSGTTADSPAPLVSSDVRLPVEASIEDLNFSPCEPDLEFDARVTSPNQEVDWTPKMDNNEYGYGRMDQPDSSFLHPASSNPATPPQRLTSKEHPAMRQPGDRPYAGSSVFSWGKAEAVQPSSHEKDYPPRPYVSYDACSTPRPDYKRQPSNLTAESLTSPSQYSWPNAEFKYLNPCNSGPSTDPSAVYITNASAIQIGHNNSMNVRSPDSLGSSPSFLSNGSANSLLKETLQNYEDQSVTEEHLDLLRTNIGATWKPCARRLGLTDVELEAIDHDYGRDGLSEKVHQMLERWRMKEGSVGCTLGRLYRALEKNVKVDVLQKLVDISKNNNSP